jgi:hypothetical protein
MTDPQKGPMPETRILEFSDIVAARDGKEAPVVVGGHAVNLWSEYYFAKGLSALAAFLPFTSKDIDLVGSAGLLDRLYESHKGKLSRSEPRSPVIGRLDVARGNGDLLRIEVLHMVNGLNAKDLARTMELRIEGMAARVLLPHLILKAKIRNSVSIQQEGRNDVKHVRMMVHCLHAFLEEFANHVNEGRLSERSLVNMLGETLEIITTGDALKASQMWDFDFSRIWPVDSLKRLGKGKISRWLEHRLGGSRPG